MLRAVGSLGLGVVLVLVGVVTEGAFGATTLVGAAATLVGLVLLARLPRALDRSVLSVRPDGLAWTGTGDADWSAPWSEVTRVRLERGRRTSSYVVVGLREGEVPLACRPAVLDDVRRALAHVAPGVVVTGPAKGDSSAVLLVNQVDQKYRTVDRSSPGHPIRGATADRRGGMRCGTRRRRPGRSSAGP